MKLKRPSTNWENILLNTLKKIKIYKEANKIEYVHRQLRRYFVFKLSDTTYKKNKY